MKSQKPKIPNNTVSRRQLTRGNNRAVDVLLIGRNFEDLVFKTIPDSSLVYFTSRVDGWVTRSQFMLEREWTKSPRFGNKKFMRPLHSSDQTVGDQT